MMYFVLRGYRVIAHDRRGHGRSTQTATGNDMDTCAADVAQFAAHLDLRDAIRVGHSTGGGEVARYVARHAQGRVASIRAWSTTGGGREWWVAPRHTTIASRRSPRPTTEDLQDLKVPVLSMHGDDDQIVAIADSALLSAKQVKNGTLKVHQGYPHGMCTIHPDVINADLFAFIKA
jgi:non-heme chloroperoxidase